MSDAEKPRPDAKSSRTADAKESGSAKVISIEQARAELLRRPRPRATPPKGVDRPARSRSREAPPPVTMPPGEHSAVIVTDTPAARAHVDKKTVHPGEAPERTHDKKVRVKTHMDPRRAKTQMTERRAAQEGEFESEPEPDVSASDEVASLWNRPSQAPEEVLPSQPSPRLSLSRARPLTEDSKTSLPVYLIAIALAALFGAGVVVLVSRGRANAGNGSSGAGTPSSAPSMSAGLGASATQDRPLNVGVTSPSGVPRAPTADPSSMPTASTNTQAVSSRPSTPPTPPTPNVGTAVKPRIPMTSAPTATPVATTKPTATSILPFGIEEP